MEFSGKVGNEPTNKMINFGGDPHQGSGYGYIRIAALVRRALAEVGTLPVLLANTKKIIQSGSSSLGLSR